MKNTTNLFAAAPTLMRDYQRAQMEIAAAANFDPALIELVKLRVSQINGCANCINMHTIEAREKGESEQRLYLLSAWRDAPCFSERERAAIGWGEAMARLSEGRDREAAYDALTAHFTEEEQIKLAITINVISGWNHIAVGFGLFADPATIRAAQAAQAAIAAAA
jgi:AhpD family alkylhydroperoxidase